MSTRLELFQAAHQAHIDWQVDRPLIDKFNHSDLQVALKLLGGEIEELNGGDKVGIFSKKNIEHDHRLREDYRQQEISDIIVFAMTVFDEMGIEVPAEAVYQQATAITHLFNFQMVDQDKPMSQPEPLTEKQNRLYGILKGRLNNQASLLKTSFASGSGENHAELKAALTNILAHAVAMHSLLGVDSGRAVLEKVARNMLKYPAWMFGLPEEDLTLEELEKLYHEKRSEAADLFDGPEAEYQLINGEYRPVDRGKEAILDPDNLIVGRPKTGTTEFYGQPEEVAKHDHSEARPIGIWYRAAAQVIASTYGFSVKVNNLLKSN